MDFNPGMQITKWQRIIFVIYLLMPSLLLAEDQYVKKQYMFIPWGEGNGNLPLNTNVQKKGNKSVISHYGPKFFKFDKDGNVYIYDYDNKNSIIKKFNGNGKEVASLVPKNPPDQFSIQGEKIVYTNNYTNKVIILNSNDLSIQKELVVPKNELDMFEGGALPMAGILYRRPIPRMNKKEKIYVFDKDERSKFPREEKNKLFFYTTNHHALVDSNSEKMNLDEKSKNWLGETIGVWKKVSSDKYGNVYLSGITSKEFSDEKYGNGIESWFFKIDNSGNLLFKLKTHKEIFLSHGSFREVPVEIDRDENIYEAWGDESGLHIDENQYKK